MIRIAILISGRGSNMCCLADAISQFNLTAEITLVAANQPCAGLEEAAHRGLSTALISRADHISRETQEQALIAEIESRCADFIFLAGYMAILSPAFVDRFSGRIINIHPSLLPAFKGLNTHRRALDAGATRHGATVHMVTAELDDGPTLLQAGLEVDAAMTADALAGKVLKLEHALFPFILHALCSGAIILTDGRPEWHDQAAALASAPDPIKTVLEPVVIWPGLAKNSN